MGWLWDALSAAKTVRAARKAGITGPLVVVANEELELHAYETAVDRKQNRILYQCIEDMAHGRSRCRHCEEYKECKSKQKGHVRGCGDWWLRFLTEDEERECRGLEPAAEESAEEDQEASLPRDDQRGADRQPDPERDNA